MIRPTVLISLGLAAGLSLALFALKYQVQDLENELVRLNRSIFAEQQAVHVLKAEWSHLNDPERLRALARRHLGMRPVTPNQLATVADLPPRPPAAAEEGAAAGDSQAATLAEKARVR